MNGLRWCTRCPFFHEPTEDCPPGWHEVRSKGGDVADDDDDGGDGSSGGIPLAHIAVWVGLALVFWALCFLVGALLVGWRP